MMTCFIWPAQCLAYGQRRSMSFSSGGLLTAILSWRPVAFYLDEGHHVMHCCCVGGLRNLDVLQLRCRDAICDELRSRRLVSDLAWSVEAAC